MQEIDSETIRNALVVVDSRESALIETGDIVTPIKQGLITPEHIHAEIGEIINAKKHGRSSQDQLTFFKSCRVAVQDVVTAAIALKNAERDNLGTIANL
jgi:ornithine cyclodeaminase/alanine dehydrogenase-like protein (mu-crystallin family)